MVYSSYQKAKEKRGKSSAKSVRFAKNLVQLSPKVKSRPREWRSVIKIGEFDLDLSGEILEDQFKFHASSYSDTIADSDVVSGILKKNVDQHISEPAVSNPSHRQMIQKAPLATLVVSNSNSNPDWDPQKASAS
jgi:hypothetical protein